ncbi:MAG TPA: DUF2809 domain-containing protein [Patescibacteria group bacterium]|nr:DUF2809 domain-containing protein [Patescibacteria group bacterium]
MKRRLVYFSLSVICFIVCILIVKLFSGNQFIRGSIGDIIVILLIYFVIKIFKDFNTLKLTIFTLAVAYTIEFIQYLKITSLLGLEHNTIAQLILGSIFDPRDLIAYTIGAILVYVIDTKLLSRASM